MLPSVSDITGQAKCRKNQLSAFRSAYESVTVKLDVRRLLSENKPTQHQREWLPVSNFGLNCVNSVCKMLKSIPSSLTDSQKSSVLLNLCGKESDEAEQLTNFIQSYYPHLVENDDVTIDI